MMAKSDEFLKMISNLSQYHREHEKYYAQNPLQQAVEMHNASRVLKTFADRWNIAEVTEGTKGNPYEGCEDLNDTATIQYNGVLFMEGEGEPPEIVRLKRDLKTLSMDFGETGEWLSKAMRASWETAIPLIQIAPLASVLGERHRIIINDWQAAYLSSLVSELLSRSVEILDAIDFTPQAIRADLSGPKFNPQYLYAASEIIDRAADLATESGILVHDNERRWRVFREKVQQINKGQSGPTSQESKK